MFESWPAVLCREEEQEEGEEYELEENSRRAGEQGAKLRRKGEQGAGLPKDNSVTCIFTIPSRSHLTCLN